jgi:addiction module RelE/StbE family toxin
MNKNKYQIKYLPIAENDLKEIISSIQTDDQNAALSLLDNIDRSVSQLKNFPYKGKTPEDNYLQSKGYRMLVIKNYIVFYAVNESINEVEIRRILHGKRKYKFLL